MKYIDAEKLITLLEQRKNQLARWTDKEYANQRIDEIDCVIVDIDSLQKEQPEEKKNCAGCPHCVDRKDQYGWHFKGCFGGPYKGKFIAEIDECPLQQEQPEVDLETVVRIDNLIMNMLGEGYNSGYKTRPFYEEVLRRLNARKEE